MTIMHYWNSPLQVFLRNGVWNIWSKFRGEHPYRSAISVKLLCNFIEITFRHGCSPVSSLYVWHLWRAASNIRNRYRQIYAKVNCVEKQKKNSCSACFDLVRINFYFELCPEDWHDFITSTIILRCTYLFRLNIK